MQVSKKDCRFVYPPPPPPPPLINFFLNAPAYGCFQFIPSTNSGSLVCHQSCLMLRNATNSRRPTFLLSGFSMLAICMIIYWLVGGFTVSLSEEQCYFHYEYRMDGRGKQKMSLLAHLENMHSTLTKHWYLSSHMNNTLTDNDANCLCWYES